MFKDQTSETSKSSHLDEMKGVSDPMFLRPYFEALSDEEALSHATKIVNMFAGNCNESMVTREYLQKAGNTDCVIIAVDTTLPSWVGNKQELENSMGERFQFVTADVIDYLKSLPDNSVDVLTAFGAEYVFPRDPRPQILRTYLAELKRVLKVGGYVISPLISIPGDGFERVNPMMSKKISG